MRKREHASGAQQTSPPTPNSDGGWVLLGRISAAQGLRGEVRIATFTEAPENIAAYGPLTSGDGRTFSITAFRPHKGANVVAQLEGVNDRTSAEALRGTELFVSRDCLPPAENDEWYISDLVGLLAIAPDGAEVGKIVAVQNYGAGDLLEIRQPSSGEEGEDKAQATLLVPFTEAAVPEVDIAERRVMVVLPEEIDAGEEQDT
ncbi:MAG: ribosome maturation factor RimM [Alphaproteobacteria bacterium]